MSAPHGAMMTEIKFECSNCSQRLLVDSDAAGMATACPTCGSTVTIPKMGGLNDRDYAGPRRPRDSWRSGGEAAEEVGGWRGNAGDLPERETVAIRPEFIGESLEGAPPEMELGETREQLAAAKAEAARFRQQLEAAAAESEKLNANALHAQVESKSFQSERLALRNELAQLRQKQAAAEDRSSETGLELLDAQARIAEQDAEIDQAGRALEALRTEIDRLRIDREQTSRLIDDLSASRKETAAVMAQLQALDVDFSAARELLAEAHGDRTSALREIQALKEAQVALSDELADARARLSALAQTEAKLRTTEDELTHAREQIQASEDRVKALNTSAGDSANEIATLRRHLSEAHTGRELLETCDRLAVVLAERETLATESRQLRDDLQKHATAARKTDEEMKSLRRQMEEAQRAAEANSEARLRRDNDVLRGIIARQNVELEQKHLQLVRLKRARLVLKLIYSFFALGLVAIGVLAVKFVPALRF